WITWRAAMQEALYGSRGFYASGQHPAAHFRTSVHASPRYAAAMLALLRDVDESLGHPDRLDLVDIGAGRGELLTQMLIMARHFPAQPAGPAPPSFTQRISPHAVEITPRPEGLDRQIQWHRSVPSRITGLVIANEWLGKNPLAGAADQAWQRRWWPLRHIGDHAEIGRPRSAAWADVIGRLDRGLALGADYGHVRASRPALGTLAGYRDGRQVRPVPDGSRDITAHVAVDACAASGEAAACAAARAAGGAPGAARTVLTTQREALRALGLRGSRPPLA